MFWANQTQKEEVVKLTPKQIATLKKHSVHHSKKHMTMMKTLMSKGKSFTESHKIAMKETGK